jgi:hypothetical protein
VELEQNAVAWRARGYEIAALSYDSPEVLRYFAEKRKLSYPLLSDPESKVIRDFGILNDKIPEKNPFRGIPYPGTYLLDPSGKVISKYFEDDYTERMTSASILVKEFGLTAPGPPHATEQTRHLRATSASSASIVRPGQKITLTLDIELAKGMHVYAPGVSGGYKQVAWTFGPTAPVRGSEPEWPKSRQKHLKAIRETVPVYEGKLRIRREVTLGNQRTLKPLLSPAGELTLESELFYQACDAKVCYVPQTVPLRWKLVVEGHDAERAPAALRRPGLQ